MSFWQRLSGYFQEYTKKTGLHGVSYLAEKRSKTEKWFWILVICLSFSGCLYMISEIVEKYENSPVVVSFSTKGTSIFEIPFPAVTICPETKCSEDKFNYSDAYIRAFSGKELNNSEMHNFIYVSLVCNDLEQNFFLKNSSNTVGSDFFDVIYQFKPKEFSTCTYMGTSLDCSFLFTPIFTDQGICYSFNILDRKDMFREKVFFYKNFQNVTSDPLRYHMDSGYSTSDVHIYPSRALLSGADNSLQINFHHVQTNTDFLCNKYYQGYRILLHNPAEIPRLSKSWFRLPLNQIVTASIEPKLVQTSEAVKNYNPEKRNCFLEHERSLKYFRIYSQQNCVFECLTNYTLKNCGCVRYFMPRFENTEICGISSHDCVRNVKKELKIQEITGSETNKCNCKPSCSSLNYNYDISSSHYYLKEYLDLNNTSDIFDNPDMHFFSLLSVYFKVDQFIATERNELYGVSDFIANIGGLFGLFMGYSLISTIEIIYFLTLRIYYNLKLYKNWFGFVSK